MFISLDNVEDVGQFISEVTVNVYRAVNLVWTRCLTCQFLDSFLNYSRANILLQYRFHLLGYLLTSFYDFIARAVSKIGMCKVTTRNPIFISIG